MVVSVVQSQLDKRQQEQLVPRHILIEEGNID